MPFITKTLTEKQLAFLEWLVEPGDKASKGSQNAFAATLGVDSGTVSKWKHDPFFKEAWEKRLTELNVSPDRVQQVVDALHANAMRGDTKAASLWLQYVEKFTPKKTVVVEDRAVSDLSDADLKQGLLEAAEAIGD